MEPLAASPQPANGSLSEEEELLLLNFPPQREDLATAVPLTLIFGLLLLTGTIGNICTAIVIARPKNKYMHTATNYYLFSLAMSDLLFLLLGLPQEMYALWQRYPYAMGEYFCIGRGFLSEASTYASILTISAFTIERYVAICHPLWAHTMSQLPRAVASIVLIWCCAALCAVPPAAGLGILLQRGPRSNRLLAQSAQCTTVSTIYENMFVVSAVVFFIVPMAIVTVLYVLIALELRRSSRMNNAISKQTSSHLSPALAASGLPPGHKHACHKHHPHHHLQQQQQQHHHCRRHRHHHHHHHNLCAYSAAARLGQAKLAPSASLLNGLEAAPGGGGGGGWLQNKATGSALLANIMSQRPSSAIGNEQACCLLVAPAAQLADSRSNTSLASSRPPAANLSRRLMGLLWVGREQLAGVDKQAGGEGEEEDGSRRHSPASFHESLMQRHHAAGQHRSVDDVNSLGPAPGRPVREQMGAARRPATGQPATCQHGRACRPASAAAGQKLLNHHYHSHARQQPQPPQPPQSQQPQQQHSRRSNAASSKKSVVRMLVAVVVSFFICWAPFHAQRLLASYLTSSSDKSPLLYDIYDKLNYISGVMYYLSSTINPLLYQLMSAKFRLAFKETFKCSLFTCASFARRASTATATATAANAAAATTTCLAIGGATSHGPANGAHSPTNSVREHHAHHRSACSTPPPPPPPPPQTQPALIATPADEGPCCCDCCCCGCSCPESMRFVQPLPAASALARLRGRLNSSLTSLLKLQQNDRTFSCSCLAQQRHQINHHHDGDGDKLAALSARNQRKILQPPPPTTSTNGGGRTRDQPGAATPLLAEEIASEPALVRLPAHRTMLKFIRSSTAASSKCARNGSSCREETAHQLEMEAEAAAAEEEEEELEPTSSATSSSAASSCASRRLAREIAEANDELAAAAAAVESGALLSADQDALVRSKMGALIRPLNARLGPATPTTGQAAAPPAASTETSGQSSAGTSPDQLLAAQATDSAPNTASTAATTATSSASSLSAPPTSEQRRAHLRDLRAEFCVAAAPSSRRRRRQLAAASKLAREARNQTRRSARQRPTCVTGGAAVRQQAARRHSLQQQAQPLPQPGALEALQHDQRLGEGRPNSLEDRCALESRADSAERPRRHVSKRTATAARQTAAGYLSSSGSSCELRLDLLSSKRLSLSTTNTSVFDDNSSLLTNNSQLTTSSNPNLLKAAKLISQTSVGHANKNNSNNNNNDTSNEEDEDQNMGHEPSTVINIEGELLPSRGAAAAAAEMAKLIV